MISAVSYRSTLSLMDAVREQSRSESMITAIEATLAGLNGAEGAQRGYIITGDSAHMPRYQANLKAVDSALHQLDSLAKYFPETTPAIRNLTALVDFRVVRFTERLTMYEQEGIVALRNVLQGDPEDLQVAAQAHALETTVRNLLADHAAKANRFGRTALGIIMLGGVAAILFMMLAAAVIHLEHDERVKAYHALREEGLKNAQFLESLPLGIFVLNADGVPSYANQSAISILGRGISPRMRSADLSDNFSVYRAGTMQQYESAQLPVVRALSGDHVTVEDIEVQRGDQRVPLQVTAAPVYASDGTIVAAIAAFTDITERRAIEQLKDELISVVSHELRTPLTSIRGALGLVGSGRLGTLNEQGTRMISIAIADTDRLVRLINDMLDIERMQAGRIELHMQECNTRELVANAVDPLRPLADRADVTIDWTAPDMLLRCDSDRIVQTLTNLIGNAIKFSPRGGMVTVDARVRNGDVEFRVTDQGHGIPPAKLETIFERFQQLDATDAREKGGAGLGLAIARSIVVQHGGRIWAESDGVHGSSFVFRLPHHGARIEPEAAARSATEVAQAPADAKDAVLIVEDDANLASVLAAQFGSVGLKSVCVGSGAEAVELTRRGAPSIIVLDVLLPGGDGYAVVEALKQDSAHAQLPVIIYTAHELTDEEKASLALGQTVFLTKSKYGAEHVVESALNLLNPGRHESYA